VSVPDDMGLNVMLPAIFQRKIGKHHQNDVRIFAFVEMEGIMEET
jgi:hypothetical protein